MGMPKKVAQSVASVLKLARFVRKQSVRKLKNVIRLHHHALDDRSNAAQGTIQNSRVFAASPPGFGNTSARFLVQPSRSWAMLRYIRVRTDSEYRKRILRPEAF